MDDQNNRSDWTFAELFNWHCINGTRPNGSPDQPGETWANQRLANAVGKTDRTIRNWRNGSSTPDDLGLVETALFGENGNYDEWRQELRVAFYRPSELAEVPDTSRLHELPIPEPIFIGREKEKGEVIRLLLDVSDQRAILIQGEGGIGKTQLTLQATKESSVAELFGERIRFATLEAAGGASDLETAVVASLGMDPATVSFTAAQTRIADISREGPCLLILDNLETPWDVDRQNVESVLAKLSSTVGLSIVASIRGRRLPRQVNWKPIEVSPLSADESADVFLHIAQRIQRNDVQLKALINELGGLPLAIDLIARQAVPHDTLEAVWEEWREIGVELAQRTGTEPSSRDSLAHSIELSLRSLRIDSLGEAGRNAERLFCLLGQLPAGIVMTDLMALLGLNGLAGQRLLLEAGLARSPEGRVDLLPPIRRYARDQHPPQNVDKETWINHFYELAKQAERFRFVDGLTERLKPEIENIDAAIQQMIKDDIPVESSVALSLSRIARLTGPTLIGSLEAMRGAFIKSGNLLGQASSLWGLAEIELMRSNNDKAETLYHQAKTLYDQTDSLLGQANCLRGLAEIELVRGNNEKAKTLYHQAKTLDDQTDSLLGQANCLWGLANTERMRGNNDEAETLLHQAKTLDDQIGNLVGQANCIRGLADIERMRGDNDKAKTLFHQAKILYGQTGSLVGQANCLWGLADIEQKCGNNDEAETLFGQAKTLDDQTGSLVGQANCLWALADIERMRGNNDKAKTLFLQAKTLYDQTDSLLGQANCLWGLANIERMRGNNDKAKTLLRQAKTLCDETGYLLGQANCLWALADIERMRGNNDKAETLLRQAKTLYDQTDSLLGQANCLWGLANIERMRGNNDKAKILFRQAKDITQRTQE